MQPRKSALLLLLAFAAVVLSVASGCASGPHYGSRKKHKECDCPKWNALPRKATDDVRVAVDPPLAHPTPAAPSHAVRN